VYGDADISRQPASLKVAGDPYQPEFVLGKFKEIPGVIDNQSILSCWLITGTWREKMGHQRRRSMKYERKGGKTRPGMLFRKREERMDIDKISADHQRRRALRDKREWLDLLEAEDMDEATRYPA
jgi:hypothetical protein